MINLKIKIIDYNKSMILIPIQYFIEKNDDIFKTK